METLWAVVTGIGSILCLVSAIYLLLDRWTKDYPSVFIFAKPLSDFGRRSLYLRVRNRSERPILVSVDNAVMHGRFRVARDNSTHAILVALVDAEATYGIDGNVEVDMPLIMPPGLNEESYDLDNTIEIFIRWRYVQPILLMGSRRLRVTSTKRGLRALLGLRGDEMF